MTNNESAKMRTDLSIAILGGIEALSPIFDAADGVRADMERRGWSPTAAEQVALQWLQGSLAQVWKST